MKRVISFILALVMILGTVATAAPGDIFHTGTNKSYKRDVEKDQKDLVDDILNGADVSKFYREIEGGKFVNIVKEEKKQVEYLQKLKETNPNLNTPEKLAEYIKSNAAKINDDFDKIAIDIAEDLVPIPGSDALELKTPKDYSIPTPGSADGTTMIEELTFPSGSSQWIYKIHDKEDTELKFNSVITGTKYDKGDNIVVEAGDFIGLYATDRSNRMKAYANILVKDEMIKHLAKLNKGGSAVKGQSLAYAISLDGLSLGTGDWKYFVRDAKLVKGIFTNDTFDDAVKYEANQDIVVADDNTTIHDNFKKFIYLIDVTDKGIYSYYEFEVNKDKISLPPALLDKENYLGPVPGNTDGTTTFTSLDPKATGINSWAYKIGDNVSLPIKGNKLGEGFKTFTLLDSIPDITAKVGDKLVLVGLVDNKVSHYDTFDLSEEKISGVKLESSITFTAEKGETPGTTIVKGITLLDGATKWMYAIGLSDDKPNVFLDRVYPGSKDYSLGGEIHAEENQTLYIFATDDKDKVKAYGENSLTGKIKDPLADELVEPINYSIPVKGSIDGTTMLPYLRYDDATKFYSKVSKDPIPIPEQGIDISTLGTIKDININSVDRSTNNIEIFKEDATELKDEKGFTMYMMVYAVDNDNKVIAVTPENFKMTPGNVELPNATELDWTYYKDSKDTPDKELLIPGDSSNSTILKKLVKAPDSLDYKYTFVSKDFIPGINEIIKSSPLSPGRELKTATLGDYLLILAVDSNGRTKYYAKIELTKDNIRSEDAQLLKEMNYTGPVAGTKPKSTMFSFLGFRDIKDAKQFMVKTSNTPFKSVELNSTVKDAIKYSEAKFTDDGKLIYVDDDGSISDVDDKNNRYLLLLATDLDGKVKGYEKFTLTSNNIRGAEAIDLEPLNYTIGKGSKPGTIKFNKLINSGIGNSHWMYKWAATEEEFIVPFIDQVINNDYATRFQINENIKVEKQNEDDYGFVQLLATNGNRAIGHTVIPIKGDQVQSTATVLGLDLERGTNADRTKVIAKSDIAEEDKVAELAKANKYIISKKEMDYPTQEDALPAGVINMPVSKEISIEIGEYLRIYNVDNKDRIIGFKDFQIESGHIKQGSATLSVLKPGENKPPKDEEGEILKNFEILEGDIRSRLIRISVVLKDANWANINDPIVKNAILAGLRADGLEQAQWDKVINRIRDNGSSMSTSGNTLTIRILATEDYDISQEQRISLTISPKAIVEARNPIDAKGEILIKPTIDAKISGTIVNNIRQSEINSGGTTIIVDLVDGEWIDTIESSASITKLLEGFKIDNAQWAKLDLKNLKLIEPQKISITIPNNNVTFTSPETVTLTIDKSLVKNNPDSDISASPAFTIYPDILPVSGTVDTNHKVELEAPNFVNARKDKDTWIVNLKGTKFKEGFSITKDLSISNPPSGLKLDIKKESDTQLSIKLVSKSTKKLGDGTINLVIKSSAVDGVNYSDSDVIELNYSEGTAIELKPINYKIDSDGIHLVLDDYSLHEKEKQLEYNITSVNGPSPIWTTINTTSDSVNINSVLEPITIHLREISQPNNKIDLKISNPDASGVSITNYEYYDTDNKKLQVTLNKNENLEYSLGASNDWKNVPLKNEKGKIIIPLTESSKLTVRTKAVDGTSSQGASLPSKPTAQLNGLFLGNVKLDVSQGKIMGADKNMKYKLSDDGTWSNISGNDPTVAFMKGNNVWISEAKNEFNARLLGTVSQAVVDTAEETQIKTLLKSKDEKEGEEAKDKKGIYYHIGDKEIVNKTRIGDSEKTINLQYNITKGAVPKGNWYDLKTIAENVNFIPGSVFARKFDDGNSLPSNPIKIFDIADPIDPPNIKVNQDDKTLLYETSGGAYRKLNEHFEYKIGSGDYYNGDLFKDDPQRFGNITVYVKRKANEKLLASKEISIKFTENISLANVRVNVAAGSIEGTTNKMEYRTDENSPWKVASANKTEINMYEGMNIWVRELGKPSTVELLMGKIQKMDPPKKESKDGEAKKWLFEYDVSQKLIKNGYGNILEYRINTGPWKTINAFDTIDVEILPTKISIRTKATIDKLASDEVVIIEDLEYPDEAPVVGVDDINNKVIFEPPIGSDWSHYEFKLKSDTEWMPGTILKDHKFEGDKVVQIRRKGGFDKLPSEIAEVTFTKNLNLEAVELRKTTPLKLVGTEVEMEYQIYLNNQPIPTTWIKASAGTTNLDNKINFDDIQLIVVRDSRNKELFKVLIGEQKDLPVDLSKISYEITKDRIIFTGIKFSESDVTGVDNARLEYKLSSPSEWTGFTVESQFPLKVTEITIKDTKYSLNTKTITISERAGEPELTVSKVEYVGEKIKLTLDRFNKDTMEYVIKKDNNWMLHPVNESDPETVEISKNDVIGVRKKATAGKEGIGKLPSTPVILNTTSLIDVGINMETPTLTNTSILMEYSLNSTNGKDGTWNKIQNPDQLVISALKLGSNIWIREIANTGNARKIGPIGQEKEPNLPVNMVYFNISTGRIANFTSQDLEYKVPGGSWKPINENLEGKDALYAFNVEFKPGNLEFRKAATGSNIASNPVIFKVIRVPLLGPNVSKGFDPVKYENIIIGDNQEKLEYSLTENGPWSDMGELDNKALIGDIYIRSKAGEHILPSLNTRLTFQPLPPLVNLKMVSYNDHLKPLQLNGTNRDMEYMINNSKVWFACDGTSTKLKSMISTEDNPIYLSDPKLINKIEIRHKNKDDNIVVVYER